jgi:hypothetical protein
MPLVRSLAYVQRTYLYTTNIKMRRKIQRAGSESESIILGGRESGQHFYRNNDKWCWIDRESRKEEGPNRAISGSTIEEWTNESNTPPLYRGIRSRRSSSVSVQTHLIPIASNLPKSKQ